MFANFSQAYEDSFIAEECEFPAKAFEKLVETDARANSKAKEVIEDDDNDEALWMDQYSDGHHRSHQLDGGGTFYFVKLPHK